jgi:hypothetical protein
MKGLVLPTWESQVRDMFTLRDVAEMKAYDPSFELDTYHYVSRHARMILRSVTPSGRDDGLSLLGVRLMPLGAPPWSEDKRAIFRTWIELGTPQRVEDIVEPDEWLKSFIRLSQEATGFESLDIALAARHHRHLIEYGLGDELLSLLKEYRTQALHAILSSDRFRPTLETVILLWYSGAIYGPGELPAPDGTGRPRQHEYLEGLVWRAARAHPSGFSLEPFGHWSEPPRESGENTGMGSDER